MSLTVVLDDNTYTNKTWADVTKILDVRDIKIMEVEFLSQMRYNLFVSPEQWKEWTGTMSKMFSYHRQAMRQRAMPKKVFYSNKSIPSPPISTASPSFSEQQYLPSGSPYRMPFPQSQQRSERQSPHRAPMDDSPSSASAAIHARVSRKRTREDPQSLQPPPKRYQQYAQGPPGIHMSQPMQPQQQPQQRIHYPTESIGLQHPYPQPSTAHSRMPLTLSLPDPSQSHSPSYPVVHQYQPISPSFPTSPYAGSPLSPYSTNSYHESTLSPYANIPHRQMQSTPQPHMDNQTGYASGYSSPYTYLQNRYSPYAPVRPVRTLPSQFVPPRMQWTPIPPEELWYQPLGMHGQTGLRRGVPAYNEYANYSYQPRQ
jgi:hypothetical protein